MALRWLAAAALFIACLAAAWALYSTAMGATSSQSEESIRQAILASAKQCAAIESSYPASLEYLEQRYGLSVNHSDYVITYESFASNVAPDVVVSAR